MASSSSVSNPKVQDRIFHAVAAPRCKKLVWSACKEDLPVRSLLLAKGIVEDDTCPCCGKGNETTMHALLQCEEVECVWFGSPLGLRVELIHDVTTVSQWIDECVELMDNKALGMVCVIMWALWHKRNVWILLHKKLDFSEVMAKACTMFFPDEWIPPSYPHIKANFSSFVKDKVGTAMGVVYRDSTGFPLASATNLMKKQCFDAEIADALCYRWALERAGELCMFDVIFETDCQELYCHWNQIIEGGGNSDSCYLDSLLEDCRIMLRRRRWPLTLVGCGGNKVARCIASEAFVYGEAVWTDDVLDEAQDYLLADVTPTYSFPYD